MYLHTKIIHKYICYSNLHTKNIAQEISKRQNVFFSPVYVGHNTNVALERKRYVFCSTHSSEKTSFVRLNSCLGLQQNIFLSSLP